MKKIFRNFSFMFVTLSAGTALSFQECGHFKVDGYLKAKGKGKETVLIALLNYNSESEVELTLGKLSENKKVHLETFAHLNVEVPRGCRFVCGGKLISVIKYLDPFDDEPRYVSEKRRPDVKSPCLK